MRQMSDETAGCGCLALRNHETKHTRIGYRPSMPSLDQFESYYAADDDAIKTAVQTGIVAPDTNVVLHLYRFQPEARDELFGAMEKLGDRLWMPHQVGRQFHRNRLTVMHEQENYFSNARRDRRDDQDPQRASPGIRPPDRHARGPHRERRGRHRHAAHEPGKGDSQVRESQRGPVGPAWLRRGASPDLTVCSETAWAARWSRASLKRPFAKL